MLTLKEMFQSAIILQIEQLIIGFMKKRHGLAEIPLSNALTGQTVIYMT